MSFRNEVFRIRYDVYFDERRFEDPSQFPDRREINQFDQSFMPESSHVAYGEGLADHLWDGESTEITHSIS